MIWIYENGETLIQKQILKRQQQEIWKVATLIEKDEKEFAQEILEDRFDVARQVLGQQAIILQNRLKEGLEINPDKQQELMRQYDQEIQGLEKNLSINQIKQQQDLVRRIELKKKERKAAIKEKERKMSNELEIKQRLELDDLKKRKAEIEAQEIVANTLPIIVEVHEENELKELEKIQKEEIIKAEKEIKEIEEQELAKVLKNASIIEAKLSKQKSILEKQKKQLMESMGRAAEDEREELIKDIARNDCRIREIIEQQSLENKKNIESRVQIRREKREEKLKGIREKQEKEKIAIENVIKEKEQREKAMNLDQAIKDALLKLPEDQKDKGIQAILEEKHENEKIELQRKLKHKLRDRQKQSIQNIMRLKANDLELIREEHREKLRLAGRDAEVSARIQKEEVDALNKLDFYYMKKIETAQEETWKDQQKKNQEELLTLIDNQLAEMRKHMKNQDSHKKESEEKLIKEREIIESEGKEKIEMLDKQKKELELLKNEKQKELEDLILKEKQREEKERGMKEALEKKRALMEKQKKERENLLKKGQLTKEQMEKLIADHQRELNALESAIARERERQVAIMSQKIAEKKNRRQEYESGILKIKEEQEKWQRELENLPEINNKQATTLLLKWRKYPKKGIKDIEKSIKLKEPTKRNLPTISKKVIISSKKPADTRIEELMWRIEKIESTVNHVDKEQLKKLVNTIDVIEQKLKTIKSKLVNNY